MYILFIKILFPQGMAVISETGYEPGTSSGSWWRHQMQKFSALLALCAGNSPATGEFPSRRPVTRSFDVFLDLRLNKRLSKQSKCWWFETPSRSLWRHCNVIFESSISDLIGYPRIYQNILFVDFSTRRELTNKRPLLFSTSHLPCLPQIRLKLNCIYDLLQLL